MKASGARGAGPAAPGTGPTAELAAFWMTQSPCPNVANSLNSSAAVRPQAGPRAAARHGPVWSRSARAGELMLASLSTTPGWRLVCGLVARLLAVVPVTACADRAEQ